MSLRYNLRKRAVLQRKAARIGGNYSGTGRIGAVQAAHEAAHGPRVRNAGYKKALLARHTKRHIGLPERLVRGAVKVGKAINRGADKLAGKILGHGNKKSKIHVGRTVSGPSKSTAVMAKYHGPVPPPTPKAGGAKPALLAKIKARRLNTKQNVVLPGGKKGTLSRAGKNTPARAAIAKGRLAQRKQIHQTRIAKNTPKAPPAPAAASSKATPRPRGKVSAKPVRQKVKSPAVSKKNPAKGKATQSSPLPAQAR